jgi:bifunctional non-homologous end joining protein LigD
VRCPTGYTGECFFQKTIRNFPSSVRTVPIYVPDDDVEKPFGRVVDLAGIVGLAQMGVLEIHPWGSRADAPEKPDRILFDLDPDPAIPFRHVAATAELLHSELGRLGLRSWLKTTGGKGLHVVVPVDRRLTWDGARAFARAFVDSIVALEPRLFTANMSKSQRDGRIFIDYLRNARGATAVCAYSTRARPGAPVSVPLTWGELEEVSERPSFTVRNLHERIASSRFVDPWHDINSVHQSITKAMRDRLGEE